MMTQTTLYQVIKLGRAIEKLKRAISEAWLEPIVRFLSKYV